MADWPENLLFPTLKPVAIIFKSRPLYWLRAIGYHGLYQTINDITLFVELQRCYKEMLLLIHWMDRSPFTIQQLLSINFVHGYFLTITWCLLSCGLGFFKLGVHVQSPVAKCFYDSVLR